LIRIIKIFGKIHNAESKMAQHHTSEISTIAVFTIIMVLLGFSIFRIKESTSLTDVRNFHYRTTLESVEKISVNTKTPSREIANMLFGNDRNVLMVYAGNDLINSRISDKTFSDYYDAEDYSIVTNGIIKIFVSHIDISKDIALEHIQSLIIIIAVVLAFMIIYTRHFVQNITDILHVMEQGFRKKDYNFQVKIRDEYRDHEINHIAVFYNDRYLPAKIRKIEKMDRSRKSGLSMNDFLNLTGSNDEK